MMQQNLTLEMLTTEGIIDLYTGADMRIGAGDAAKLADNMPLPGLIYEDGRPIAGGGVYPKWTGTGIAWLAFHRRWRRYANDITAIIAQVIDGYAEEYDRIEAGVLSDWRIGRRYAERFGFILEADRMRSWDASGRDYALYARVR